MTAPQQVTAWPLDTQTPLYENQPYSQSTEQGSVGQYIFTPINANVPGRAQAFPFHMGLCQGKSEKRKKAFDAWKAVAAPNIPQSHNLLLTRLVWFSPIKISNKINKVSKFTAAMVFYDAMKMALYYGADPNELENKVGVFLKDFLKRELADEADHNAPTTATANERNSRKRPATPISKDADSFKRTPAPNIMSEEDLKELVKNCLQEAQDELNNNSSMRSAQEMAIERRLQADYFN